MASSSSSVVVMVIMSLFLLQNLSLCWSLNSEGLALLSFRERVVRDPYGALANWDDSGGGDTDHCFWFGVECSHGKVVILNLRDLCLRGTLAPELGNLTHLKSIILRNNSLSGTIPEEIGELKELEVLDLGYNNFTGLFPSNFGNNLPLTLLLDNNRFLGSISPELHELQTLSEFQVDEKQLSNSAVRASCSRRLFTWKTIRCGAFALRRQLQQAAKKAKKNVSKSSPPSRISLPPSPSFSASPSPLESPFQSPSSSPTPAVAPSPAPSIVVSPPPKPNGASMPSPASIHSPTEETRSKSKHHVALILAGTIGGVSLILMSVLLFIFSRSSKVVTVKPWVTGLSGQLQKAFVTGVPKLKRQELVAACEDFSNIIGSFSEGTIYKGTLSSGVEIAVTSTKVQSRKDWSKNLGAQFRKKIETLSKVNHKNFINLIGYCEEDEPFTRMMVFEYAPNGTLFEHLHIQEADHLDWTMRLRIAMGMAYCLEHMHQLTPPIALRNLQSSSVYLTEDYAAKISDFSYWNDITASDTVSTTMELSETKATDLESDVYSFGVILFEMITGRIPYSMDNGSLENWLSDSLRGDKPSTGIVDPTLKNFQENELMRLFEVVNNCVHPDPIQRPTMRDIAAMLKDITSMGPDGATPKLSPLWWAELEILSSEAS
ncbi:hypothetical protein Ddye_025097 [Dipteronia dyeriana]|uniref:Protein kinase domain-containing protein n=1 Tax=Dipteronia dyeriana TaxID=168575 RepID=A0AAD9WTL0_9ROSI|nr:hypothetical protein Ddye_025097 [Dipteronia dyeriana]